MPPQSPHDEDLTKVARSTRRSRDVWIVGLLLVIGLIAATPAILRQRVKAIETYAVSNARALGMCLFEFEREYGKFPGAATVERVKAKSGSLLLLGTNTSNDYFRQLIASGIAPSEQIFYADITGTRKPDGLIDGNHAIAKGECGYSYLSGLSAEGNPSRPIVVTPLIHGTNRFDSKPFEGKSVLLRLDNSVTSLPIDKQGNVFVIEKSLFDPSNPMWGGKLPVVVSPDL
jgi:hypothetical protein